MKPNSLPATMFRFVVGLTVISSSAWTHGQNKPLAVPVIVNSCPVLVAGKTPPVGFDVDLSQASYSIWTDGTGADQLKEQTRYVFHAENGKRSIDRIATLTALQPVTFHDDKEGMLGIRIAHFLESATEKGGLFNDASGHPIKVAEGDNTGATGVYRTSAGLTGDAAFGTRGAWCSLTGTTPEGKAETVVILDNPKNPGFPSYWHARGYGLFAVNPLGDHIFDPKAPEHNFMIPQGQSATFRYRILLSSNAMTPQQVDAAEAAFAK